jgi:hypothetical protein
MLMRGEKAILWTEKESPLYSQFPLRGSLVRMPWSSTAITAKYSVTSMLFFLLYFCQDIQLQAQVSELT